MKTINLEHDSISLAELLALAREEAIVVVSNDGHRFVLEEADEEGAEDIDLGESEAFARFLKKRATEPGSMSIEQYADRLNSIGDD